MKKIGELLVDYRVISKWQLDEALKEQNRMDAGVRQQIGEILIEKKFLTYDTLIEYLRIQKEKS